MATIKLYGNCMAAMLNKEIDWNESNKIKVMLCTSSYTPNQDTHDYKDDVTNEVAASGGYSSGGAVIANCTLTYTALSNSLALDGDDVVWAASTITARYGVIYYSTGVDSTSPLIAYIDFGMDVSSSGTNFTITWAPSGIITGTVAA